MAARSAAAAVDWATLYGKLGLGKETITALQAFRARHTTAQNRNAALKSSIPEVDIAHYRSIIRDQSAVQQVEKALKEFKPVDYDVKKWDSAVQAFQTKAVDAAKATVEKVSTEEKTLKETLSHIEDTRPWEDITSDDVAKAAPEVRKAVETMVRKGRWSVPGYREKFGDFALM